MTLEWDVGIPVDDGLVLRADVFRPSRAGRYPVLLSYGPYGKGLAFSDGYPDQWARLTGDYPEVLRGSSNRFQVWEVADPEKWVPDGYVCVRVDSRGAGRSPGFVDPFSPRETRDLYECIEWAGTRDWSNGKVGLLGVSYFAINQWHVAARQPPHLAAICPWEGAADWYRDMVRHGGILCDFFPKWMQTQVVTVQHGLGERGPRNPNTDQPVAGPATLTDAELDTNRADMRREVRAHPLDDDYYRARSADWSRVTVPILSAANWGGQGLHPRGNFEGFLRAASTEKWLEVHGLEHWTTFYLDSGLRLQKQFFDQYLKGEDNAWPSQPRVQLQVRHVDRFEHRAENEWPLARTRWSRWYLDAGTHRLASSPPATEAAAEFGALSEELILSTDPFPTETELTGPLAAHVWIASTTSDADLFVIVQLWDPSGREVDFQGALDPHTPIAQGWLRASQRELDPALSTPWRPYHTHAHAEPLQPGVAYPVEVEVWPTSIVIPVGYRLTLTVRGRDLERSGEGAQLRTFVNHMRGCGPFIHTDPEDRAAGVFDGRTTLLTGPAHESYLLVPVIPSGKQED
jgi:putative CocE/NonD family hydrolase